MSFDQANATVMEGIRRTLNWGSLPQAEFDNMTINILRENLRDSLEDTIANESDRLDFLRISIRRQCRKMGWKVQTPGNSWFTTEGNQDKLVISIAEFIISNPLNQF